MTTASPARHAVIGNPIGHSRSPRIHTLFGQQTGVAVRYEALLAPLDGFEETVRRFFAEGGQGANVTVPFKLQAYALAQAGLSARAREAGAVNTLWMQDGRLHGCNTDGVGLVQDLRRLGAALQGAHVLLVGAGGAARGALGPLAQAGCAAIHVVNRTEPRAHALLAEWRGDAGRARLSAGALASAARPQGWDVVVNATASGLADRAPELPAGLYRPGALAYDMMYGAQPTAFMRQAQAEGAARTADGLGMLVAQAAESFRIWHGVLPDTAAVLQAVRDDLAQEAGAAGAAR
ncbi:shikimate dehydrogenase [Orrella sp. JC864]|uniref:shikimate dehydrogenase n=1 Tax=Orrella sp. JC864 TaxID=3120298 RepID=UPI00300ACADC